MAGLNHQLFLVNLILISVATITTAVPFDRQLSLSSDVYSPKNISTSSENVCMIDDVLYQDGDAIPTASPCEKCVCRPPGFACSIITCEKRPNCRALQRSNQCCPEYKCDCEVEGKVYHNGEKLDNTLNPCKVCYCQGGEVACTVIECYKRDDCVPKHVPGMCCPKYDNCPPRDPARSASSSFSPPIPPTNSTAAKDVHKMREVARDRLNLLGETEAAGQLLPERPISNNVYDLPQGDDPQVYVAYDNSDTSTSTTGFVVYDDGLTSTTMPNYNSLEEASSSSSSSSTSETQPWTRFPTFPTDWVTQEPEWTDSTSETQPWTGFPTFPTDWPTQWPEWTYSTSISTEGGSTEYIPTWGTDYSTETSSPTPSTSTSEQSTSTSTSSTTEASSTVTASTLQSISADSTSVPTTSTDSTPDISTLPHSSSSASSESQTTQSDDASTSTSTSDSQKSSGSTTTAFTLDDSTVTTNSNPIPGSGDGESDPQTSNCIDGSENCDQRTIIDSDNDSYTSVTLDDNLYDVIQADGTTNTNDETGTEINDDDTTEQNYSSEINHEGEAYLGDKKIDVTTTEKDGFTTTDGSSETDSSGAMAADMAQADQGQHDVNDFWNDGENQTTQKTLAVGAETKILPGVLSLRINNTMEGLKVDSNGTVKANADVAIPQEWLKKTDGDEPGDADGNSTLSDDSSAVNTDGNAPTSTEADGYETSTTLDYDESSASSSQPTTDTTTEDTFFASNTHTTESSASETFSTTQTSETGSQSTGTWSEATTTQISS